MKCMETADTFKKDTVLRASLSLYVHRNAITESSSNNGQNNRKALFYGAFRFLFSLCDVNVMLKNKAHTFPTLESHLLNFPLNCDKIQITESTHDRGGSLPSQ